jgi:hypothetical protein
VIPASGDGVIDGAGETPKMFVMLLTSPPADVFPNTAAPGPDIGGSCAELMGVRHHRGRPRYLR